MRRSTRRSLIALLLTASTSACDPDTPSEPRPDTPITDTATLDVDALDADSQQPDTRAEDSQQPDADAEVTGDTSTGLLCSAGEACNARLTEDGRCPGVCVEQRRGATCRGVVAHGLCYDGVLPRDNERYNLPDGMWAELAETLPAEAVVGEEVTIRVRIHNPGDRALEPNAVARARQPGWTLLQTSFTNDAPITVPAGGELVLSATLRAERATVFDTDSWWAVFINVGTSQVGVRLPIGFGQGAEIACGAHTFPGSWCSGNGCERRGEYYETGRCCGDVFYPSAECCEDADCAAGACFDGLCVEQVPSNVWSPSPLIGRQQILVIATDLPGVEPGPLCEHDPMIYEGLGLPEVDAWLRARASERLQRDDALELRWRVLHIPDTTEILTDPDRSPPVVSRQLEDHLLAQGCLEEGFLEDADRTLIISSALDLGGSAGRAFDVGLACARSPWPRSLLTHELSHLYGARDLYSTVAGALQWRSAMMSRAELDGRRDHPPSDAVFWGEVGLGDVDDSGVLDAFEFPIDPRDLAVEPITATYDPETEHLQLIVPFTSEEAGERRPHPIPRFDVELVDTGVTGIGYQERANFYGFPGTEAGVTLRVRVQAEYHHTDPDWSRRALRVDTTQTLTVEPAP